MTLKKGDKGASVKQMQWRIIDWGFGADLGRWGADGDYGNATVKSVKHFQIAVGLPVTGIADEATLGWLDTEPIRVKHFSNGEFRCRHCRKLPSGGMDYALLILLERIRKEAGDKPVIVNSGYRCLIHNIACGGAQESQHLYGRAADIRIPGMSTQELYAICDKLNPYGGVGIYIRQGFVHVDVRGKKARW